MNFKIYLIGDKIPKHFKSAIEEYEKRLSRYCKIQLIEVKNQDMLTKSLTATSFKIYLSVKGENVSSTELATKFNEYATSGKSEIAIIYGIEPPQFDEHLAISRMDIEDGLLITILFEQIYRAYRILHNHAYHK